MSALFTVPVTLVTRTRSGQDSLGNDVYTTAESTVDGIFAPGGSTELVQGQDLVIDQPTVYLPTGTAAKAVDAVKVYGDTYEVAGTPRAWPPNPFTGWLPDFSVEVRLTRVTG